MSNDNGVGVGNIAISNKLSRVQCSHIMIFGSSDGKLKNQIDNMFIMCSLENLIMQTSVRFGKVLEY
jgi:hypothetical protein